MDSLDARHLMLIERIASLRLDVVSTARHVLECRLAPASVSAREDHLHFRRMKRPGDYWHPANVFAREDHLHVAFERLGLALADLDTAEAAAFAGRPDGGPRDEVTSA